MRDERRVGAHFFISRLVVVACLLVAPAAAQTDDEDPEVLEARLEALREQIAAIQQRLADDRAEHDQAAAALAEAERELGRLGRILRETEAAIDAAETELDALRDDQRALEQTLAGEQEVLGEQLRAAHQIGSHSRLRMMLNQDDPEHVARALAYHSYLTRARVDIMQEISQRLEALLDVRRRIEQRLDDLDHLHAAQADTLAQQEQARAQRALAVEAAEARVRDGETQLAELEDNAAELEVLIEALTDALADIPPEIEVRPFAELRGHLPMPVDGPVRASFGQRRSDEINWSGWLIGAEIGTEVSAVAHGRVAFSDWLRGYGMVLIIDHGEGYMSLYAHNESLLYDVGDWVHDGQVIALVGNSGGARESGLYFELRSQGRAIDPAPWLAR